ncbi:MAG: CTP synthase [Chloroflexi bacterium]|nr:MAG: CTP synthase [Chloroflexota bacterium]
MPKFIFVTGGVVSGLGKGVTAAAIGRILKSRSIKVSIQKLDPYINVDPGTMSPYQHGEVFVLEEGAETDLDLGHYERFIDENLTNDSNVTTGQVYSAVIAKERRGDFLGATVQTVPHITNEIKRRIASCAARSSAEVLIVEVGGTVGDIEGQPFLEAIRQMRHDVGRENAMYVHVTLLPYLSWSGEVKTKPTQHSVKELRGIGIQPDVIIARTDRPVEKAIQEKIALFTDVEPRAVIPLVTSETVYEVPLVLEEAGLGDYIVSRLALQAEEPDLTEWREMVERIKARKPRLNIALVGKYVELPDAYMSVKEALTHAGIAHAVDIDIAWVDSEELEHGRGWEAVYQADGIIVPGGFGHRGIEGKIAAARYAREHKVPYLGLCLGMQIMVIELARHALGLEEANSTEFNRKTPHPVIDLLPEQRGISDMGGTMRLGAYPCRVRRNTRAWEAYGQELISERRRHRFEVNNEYRAMLERAGLVVSGTSPDGNLVEIAEIADHPWMVGSQFHPEFKSRPNRPHPLFRDFVGAAKQYRYNRQADSEARVKLQEIVD